MLTGVATVIEIGTRMIEGAGEIIQGVGQHEMMAIGLLAEGKGTAATGDLLHGGSSGAAVATMSVIVTVHQETVTVHQEARCMSHVTEVMVGAENANVSRVTEVMDGAENATGHSEIVMVRDTAAGVEMCATEARQMAVRPAMFVGTCVAAAAGSGMEEALSGRCRWKTA
jgi:hypothetical protein